jgi:hypothetical protein
MGKTVKGHTAVRKKRFGARASKSSDTALKFVDTEYRGTGIGKKYGGSYLLPFT